MLDGLTAAGLVQGGASGLLALVTFVLIRMALNLYRKIDSGELVPKATLDALEAVRAERLADLRADRDAWRATADTSARQVDQLLEYAETTDAFIRELRARAGRTTA